MTRTISILLIITSMLSCATLDNGKVQEDEYEKYIEPENFDMPAALEDSESESQPSDTLERFTSRDHLGIHLLQGILCGIIVAGVDISALMLLGNGLPALIGLPIVFLLTPSIGSSIATLTVFRAGYIEKPFSAPSLLFANASHLIALGSAVAGGLVLTSRDYWQQHEIYLIIGVSYILPSAVFASIGTALAFHVAEE